MNNLREAIIELQEMHDYRDLPLQVRGYFDLVAEWLPAREASFPLSAIDAGFARRLRDKASRERGYKFGNYTLFLIQVLVKRRVASGAMLRDSVRNIPKLQPVRPLNEYRRRDLQSSTCRRRQSNIRLRSLIPGDRWVNRN